MAHSAYCHHGVSRLGQSRSGALLLAVASTAALLLVGCDTDTGRADKKVSQQVDHATRQFGDSEADWTLANKELNDAARETTASLPRQLQAKVLLADSELQMAQALAKQVLASDTQIDRLSGEIQLLCNDIQSNNQMVAVLAKYDPTELQAKITADTAEVAGTDDNSVWAPSDATKLLAITANKKQIDTVTGKITDLQADIKTKTDQRNQLLDQADKLTQQSQHESKQKSVDLFLQGSKARKDAADLTAALDQQNVALAAAQGDLAVLQAGAKSLTDAQQVLTDKSTAVGTDWNSIKDEQASLNKESKTLLGDDPVNPPMPGKNGDLKTDPTIGSKAAAIQVLVKGSGQFKGTLTLRSDAETHFSSAIDKYKEAADLATKIQQELGERTAKADQEKPDQLAWADEQKALDSTTYKYFEADAEMQKANFFAQSASEATTRLAYIARVASVIKDAQLTAFPSVDDSDQAITTQKQKAVATAREAYGNAIDLLSNFQGSAPPEVKSTAEIQVILGQFAWYLLELNAGDAAAASNHLALAKTAVTAAMADNVVLPALPRELAASATPAGSPGVGMPARVPGGVVTPPPGAPR